MGLKPPTVAVIGLQAVSQEVQTQALQSFGMVGQGLLILHICTFKWSTVQGNHPLSCFDKYRPRTIIVRSF